MEKGELKDSVAVEVDKGLQWEDRALVRYTNLQPQWRGTMHAVGLGAEWGTIGT